MKLPSIKELFSSPNEFHAFIIGFFEVLCPWPANRPHRKDTALDAVDEAISKEYHYYLGGRGAGVIAWIIIARLIQVLFW